MIVEIRSDTHQGAIRNLVRSSRAGVFLSTLCAFMMIAAMETSAQESTKRDDAAAGVPDAEATDDSQILDAVSTDDAPILMEEIVVTARKRAQPAFEVPLSLSTIQEAKSAVLRSSGMDLRFLSNRVPSLQMESSYGRVFPRFYIRGLGNTDFDLNASQPVSVIYDGVVLENALLKGYPAFDLDRIEVIRGPQGSLFGRNTPAGIVKLESARPTEEPEGFGRLGYGRFNTAIFEGAVSGPLGSPALSARLSVLVQRRGDWVDNEHDGPTEVLGGYREMAGRLQFRWRPTSDLVTLINIHGRDRDGSARMFRANVIEPDRGGLVKGFSRDRIAIDGRNSQELNAHGMTVEVRYQAGVHELVSLTGMERLESFSRGDIDGGFGAVFSPPSGPGEIPFPSETAGGIPFLRQISQEIRLVSQEHHRLDYLFGLYYLHESVDIDDYNYDTCPVEPATDTRGSNRSPKRGPRSWRVPCTWEALWRSVGDFGFPTTRKTTRRGGTRHQRSPAPANWALYAATRQTPPGAEI